MSKATNPDQGTIVVQQRGSQGMVAGVLGCIFGTIGIFVLAIIFVPLAFLCGVIGLIRGVLGNSAAGIGTAILACVLAGIGFLLSPVWMLTTGFILATQAVDHSAEANVPAATAYSERHVRNAPSSNADAMAEMAKADVADKEPRSSNETAVPVVEQTRQTGIRVGAGFQWPETNPNVVPDARLNKVVEKARAKAARAHKMASEAETLAGRVTNRLDWNRLRPETVSDGVTLIGQNLPNTNEPGLTSYVGKITYRHGSEFVGGFKFIQYPNHSTWGLGVVRAPAASPVSTFKGEIAAPADIRARPAQGIATFDNGDQFAGLYYLYFHDTDAVGIYQDATTGRRFIGQLETVERMLQPKEGLVEDANGRLLSVVRQGV